MITLILITVIALFFTAVGFSAKDYVQKLACTCLGIICWLAGAAKSTLISIPYSFLYENTVDNSYTVITGNWTVLEQGLPWLYLAIAVLLVAYMFYYLSGRVFGGGRT